MERKLEGLEEDAKPELVVKERQLNDLSKKVGELEDMVSNDRTELLKEKAQKNALQEALEA